MNRVIRALGISKSSVYFEPKGYPKRKAYNRKEISNEIIQAVAEITQKKATYGVPRVKAILERDYAIKVTKHLLHRHMKESDLLIKRNVPRGASREHTGKVMVDKPNKRWSSDITTIKCWNGEKLKFTYILDCCDRNIISWRVGKNIQASDIEIMFQEALFIRFGESLPKKDSLQFLHDNGPEYLESKFQCQLKKWNIKNCNTPTYSPQSNGMCEAFNGTFKRDYVYESCLDSAEYLASQFPKWLLDYNTYAPHSALGMKTPEEFFNYKMAA